MIAHIYMYKYTKLRKETCVHACERVCLKFAVHIFHVPVTWQSVSVLHDHDVDVCVQHM